MEKNERKETTIKNEINNKKRINFLFFSSFLNSNIAVAMKKLFLRTQKFSIVLGLLLLAALFVNAGDVVIQPGQLDLDGKMVVVASGNVGIGTTSPAQKLHVSSVGSVFAGRFESDQSSVQIELFSSDAKDWRIVGGAGTDGMGFFQTPDNEYALFINGNRNVGIGTVSPQSPLHVNGNIQLKDGSVVHFDGNGAQIRGSSSSQYLAFETVNTERMRIDSSGNVGIGITNPQRTLHINDLMRLEPRSTAPTGPALGDVYVDSDSNELCFYDGSLWTGLKTGGVCA